LQRDRRPNIGFVAPPTDNESSRSTDERAFEAERFRAEILVVIARHTLLRAATGLLLVAGIAATSQADDCFRRLGFGFSAGYHAPVACPTPGCHQKLSVWHGWKQACTLPNVRSLGGDCDCAPCAPCAPTPACNSCGPSFFAPRMLQAMPGVSGCGVCNGRMPAALY
jgi:hypothetical protein